MFTVSATEVATGRIACFKPGMESVSVSVSGNGGALRLVETDGRASVATGKAEPFDSGDDDDCGCFPCFG